MMAPEFCRVLGKSKWYFCGLVAPSVVWRVSSLALSVEARDSVVCLMDAFSAANPQYLSKFFLNFFVEDKFLSENPAGNSF